MSDISLRPESPFEAIRRMDNNGVEYWMARELMPELGYSRWADFKAVVDRAMLSCQNTQNNVTMHFSGSILKSQGRPSEDWKLSRFGSYLVAMNGDPRKERIAMAQSYFAVKTHEAETRDAVKPKTQAEMLVVFAQQFVEQERRVAQLEASSERTDQRLTAIEVEQDRFNAPSGHKYTVLGFAKLKKMELSRAVAASFGKHD